VDNSKKDDATRPRVLKFGLNHVTTLIENKKAKMVVIANDVDPIELVLWLPQLCRKQDVPYCIVKNKERLGRLVGQKTAVCVALTDIRKEDEAEFNLYTKNFRAAFNDNE
jgi:large subunit ribosomal protein L7Ae